MEFNVLPGEAIECDWFVGQARVLKRKVKKKKQGGHQYWLICVGKVGEVGAFIG